MELSVLVKRMEDCATDGVISTVRKALSFTDEPKFPQWFCEPFPDRFKVEEEQYGSSLALEDNVAKVKAMGEAIERYCSETVDKQRIVSGTFLELSGKAVDPAFFINYDDNFLKGQREKYLQKIREAKLTWIDGKYTNTKKEILIPAQLVFSPYDISKEPLVRTPLSTGAAFGTDETSTIERGLLEIIERDSFMLRWLTKKSCPRINLREEFGELKEYFERYLLEPYVIDLTTDLGIPSMAGILIDRTGVGPAVSVGLKSSTNPKDAVLGSLLEAQHVRGWMRFTYYKNDMPKVTKASDIVDLKSRGKYWYDTEKISALDFWLDRKNQISLEQREYANLSEGKVAGYIINKSFDVYTIDVSTKPIKDRGFLVIKSLVPQLHPLSLDEDVPYLHSERLFKYLNGEPNTIPHPFL